MQYLHKSTYPEEQLVTKRKSMYGVSEVQLYKTVLGNIKFQLTDAKERLYDDSNVTHKRSSTALLPKQTS